MLIGDRVEDLCLLDVEFLEALFLSQVELSDENLIKFVDCNEKKGYVAFPRVSKAWFKHNKL